jgi:hypothetical protein
MYSELIHWIDTVLLFDYWPLSFSVILFAFTISSPWRLFRNKNIYIKNQVLIAVHALCLATSLFFLYRYIYVVDLINKADIFFSFYLLFSAVLVVGKLFGKRVFNCVLSLFRNSISLTDFYVRSLFRLNQKNTWSSLITTRLFFIAPFGNVVEKRIHYHLNNIEKIKGNLVPLAGISNETKSALGDDSNDSGKDDEAAVFGSGSKAVGNLNKDSDRHLPFLLDHSLTLSRLARTREPVHAYSRSLNSEITPSKQAYKGDRGRIQIDDFSKRVDSYLLNHDFEGGGNVPWSATAYDDVFLLEIQTFSWCLLLRIFYSGGRKSDSFSRYSDLFEVWVDHLNRIHEKKYSGDFEMSGLETTLIQEHKDMVETLLDLGSRRHDMSGSDFKIWTAKYYDALDYLSKDDLSFDKGFDIDIFKSIFIALYFKEHHMHTWAQNILSRVIHLVSFRKPESPVRALLARLYYNVTVEIHKGSEDQDQEEDSFNHIKWSSSRLNNAIHSFEKSHIGRSRFD